MAEHPPASTEPFTAGRAPVPWDEARERLRTADRYWLATVRAADGAPDVVPVAAVWLDGALYTTLGRGGDRRPGLARAPRCVLSAGCGGMELVLQGVAATVGDEATLARVGDAYAAKYGAPAAAGPPGHDVYAVAPRVVLGFPTGDGRCRTRWRFPDG